MTTLIQQYKAIKTKYPDAILLFRIGDYYEVFGEDAKTVSKILGLKVTKGDKDNDPIQVTTFPHFALDVSLSKLVKAGHKVAVCDQLEDPKKTSKSVKRGVTDFLK